MIFRYIDFRNIYMEYLICNLESEIFPHYNMPHTTKSFIQFYLKKKNKNDNTHKSEAQENKMITDEIKKQKSFWY